MALVQYELNMTWIIVIWCKEQMENTQCKDQVKLMEVNIVIGQEIKYKRLSTTNTIIHGLAWFMMHTIIFWKMIMHYMAQ